MFVIVLKKQTIRRSVVTVNLFIKVLVEIEFSRVFK